MTKSLILAISSMFSFVPHLFQQSHVVLYMNPKGGEDNTLLPAMCDSNDLEEHRFKFLKHVYIYHKGWFHIQS